MIKVARFESAVQKLDFWQFLKAEIMQAKIFQKYSDNLRYPQYFYRK